LPPNVDTLKLPGLRKVANGEYSSRRIGLPKSHLREFRSAVLSAAVEAFRPDVVLVDKHPFGAKGELASALSAAKSQGACVALGLRDVLDDPAVVAQEWGQERIPERIADWYELVLVYGDRTIFDPLQHCPLPPVMTGRTKYCGYVVGPAGCTSCQDLCPHQWGLEPLAHPTVLCTVGGGEDGLQLLKAFLGAAAGADWKGIAVAGPLVSESDLQQLQQIAGKTGVTFYPSLPCLSRLFWRVDALVCMGGYNTLVEAVSKGVPVVCVPRTVPRSEQLLRARAFEKNKLLRMLLSAQLTPEELGREVAAALQQPRAELLRHAHRTLNFCGAQAASQFLVELRKGHEVGRGFQADGSETVSSRISLADPA
jgi:predicted glycosyltransferase